MSLSRRKLLAGFGVVVGFLGITALSTGLRDWLSTQLSGAFGQDISLNPETSAFLDDYLAYLKKIRSFEYNAASVYFRIKPGYLPIKSGAEVAIRRHMFGVFLRATNVIRAIEVNEDFQYTGIFDPELYPCSNQLSAQAL